MKFTHTQIIVNNKAHNYALKSHLKGITHIFMCIINQISWASIDLGRTRSRRLGIELSQLLRLEMLLPVKTSIPMAAAMFESRQRLPIEVLTRAYVIYWDYDENQWCWRGIAGKIPAGPPNKV